MFPLVNPVFFCPAATEIDISIGSSTKPGWDVLTAKDQAAVLKQAWDVCGNRGLGFSCNP